MLAWLTGLWLAVLAARHPEMFCPAAAAAAVNGALSDGAQR